MHRSLSPALRPLRRAIILSLIILVSIYLFLFRRELNYTYRPPRCLGPFCFVATPKEANISQTCKIPEIDLYHKSFVHLLKPSKLTSDCTRKQLYPLLFNATVNSELVPVVPVEKFHSLKINSCCYRNGSRAPVDANFYLSDVCYPFSLEHATKIPKVHEFIAIFCRSEQDLGRPAKVPFTKLNCVDVLAFVPMKKEVEERLENLNQRQQEDSGEEKYEAQKLSVAIFGIDAVSKANLLRTMPKTHKYLVEVMGAVDVEGYNKVGDHTLLNLAKLLTSRSWENLTATCQKNMFYDDCPFIWKDFAREGYITALVEDTAIEAIFNRMYFKGRGFVRQPTDYYLRPLALISDYFFRFRHRTGVCQGPRLFYKTVLDYMEKFLYTMNKESRPFFYFSWESSLTHDDINDAQLADEPTLRSLKWIHENKMLENTVFIFLSDHGMHQGKVLEYRQGQLEDRLPLLYFVFPEWFKERYRRAFFNFQGNVRRLTHTLDIYHTLQDILNLDQLEEDILLKREEELHSQFRNENLTGVPPPLGISMFLPVPLGRACRHTFIEPEFCICTMTAPVDIHDRELMSATTFALKEMNKAIEQYKRCTVLILKEIKNATWNLYMDEETTYTIHFVTKFGGYVGKESIFPEFDAVVQRDWSLDSEWKLVGNVTTPKMYGNYSWCVPNGEVHPYCFCRIL